jgi:AmmeMemoRadiSam system protein B
VLALVVPHAGYIYSGPVAAHAYRVLKGLRAERAVIVGPNHYAYGSPLATYVRGSWATPLGDVAIDEQLARRLLRGGLLQDDYEAHRYEHSIEVQLPFLQYIGNVASFVPICLGFQEEEVARPLAKLLQAASEEFPFVLLASSDFTHYEPHDVVKRKDLEQVKAISSLDLSRHYETMRRLGVTMCGYGAIATAIEYSRLKGAREVKLLCHATSGDTGGDRSSVVGYAALAFVR